MAAEELAGAGVRSLVVSCDVSDYGSVEALADRVWKEFGRAEVLFNNASVGAARLRNRRNIQRAGST